MITFGTGCSGIESASIALEPLGWQPVWFSEIEPFPCALLEHYWPHVCNVGDFNSLPIMIRLGAVPAPDVFIAGTPCQSFSIAGKGEGLENERGQLTLKYIEVINAIDEQRPGNECVGVWENVPGILSKKDNPFGNFLAALVGEDDPLEPPGGKWKNAGYVSGPKRRAAWRILGAQYFGVAQRRRRLFVIASARNGIHPEEILFESEGVRRDTPPSRETGEKITEDAARSVVERGVGAKRVNGSHWDGASIHPTLSQALKSSGAIGYSNQEIFSQGYTPIVMQPYDLPAFGQYGDGRTRSTVKQRDYKDHTDLVVAFHASQDPDVSGSVAHPIGAQPNGMSNGVLTGYTVRRLTPRECERLQGFPDDYTLVPWRTKKKLDDDAITYFNGDTIAAQQPDGARYKAIGNSKATVKVQWLGKRIERALNNVRLRTTA